MATRSGHSASLRAGPRPGRARRRYGCGSCARRGPSRPLKALLEHEIEGRFTLVIDEDANVPREIGLFGCATDLERVLALVVGGEVEAVLLRGCLVVDVAQGGRRMDVVVLRRSFEADRDLDFLAATNVDIGTLGDTGGGEARLDVEWRVSVLEPNILARETDGVGEGGYREVSLGLVQLDIDAAPVNENLHGKPPLD